MADETVAASGATTPPAAHVPLCSRCAHGSWMVKIGQNLSKVVKSSSKSSVGQNGQNFGAPKARRAQNVF
eukprot:502411-Prymnesium_polylepis.1